MWQNSLGASKFCLILIFGVFIISCSGNLLSELSNENTDAALFEEAQKQLNDGNYALAVAACEDMSATATTNREVAYICASAYSARCGNDFLSLLIDLVAYAGTPNLMEFMSDRNLGATATDVTDCVTATTLLQIAGDASARTDDENFLMVMNSLQTVGVIANLYADTDDDGAIDGGYDTCGDIDDTNAEYIAEALWEIEASAGSTGITELSNLATAIDTLCNDGVVGLQAGNPAANFCSAVDTESFTATQLLGARGVFRENTATFGLGDCAGTPSACICP